MHSVTRYAVVLLVAASLVITGCANRDFSRQDAGTATGAILGGIGGAQIGGGRGQLIATGLGTLLGAAIGSEIGRTIDEVDRQRMAEATHTALERAPTRERVEWRGREAQGWVEPTRTYERSYGQPRDGWDEASADRRQPRTQYCREFTTEIVVAGEAEKGYGTACRQPDGTWEIQ